MPQDSLTAPSVIPPDGYSVVSSQRPLADLMKEASQRNPVSEGPVTPRPLKDLMAEASKRNPPTPPAGYILDPDLKILQAIRQKNSATSAIDPRLAGTADFLKPIAAQMRVVNVGPQTDANGQITASVPWGSSNEVDLSKPNWFSPDIQSHEATHAFQFSRHPSTHFVDDPLQNPYNYGGIDGLLQAQAQGKTIANFGIEQQAKMVQDYHFETEQAIRTGDGARLDRAKKAYEPFIRELSQLPDRNDPMTRINTSPAPPPGPPANVAGGTLKPSDLIGGEESKNVRSAAQRDKLGMQSPPWTPPPTPPAVPTSTLAPHTPTVLEQLRDTVANSAIGHGLEGSLPKLADALNLHPSETVNSPTYEQHKEQLLAPEYAAPAAISTVNALSLPGTASIDTQANRERMQGVLQGVGGLTSAPNMSLLAGTSVAAGVTAGIINPVSAQLLSRLVSGGFTLDMLHGLYQQNQQYRNAVDSGNLSEAHKIQGEMGVTGIMAALTAKHALTSHPFTPVTETPTRERTNVLQRNEVGEVRQANGQAPAVWLSPTGWKSFMGTLYPEEDAAATHGVNLPANNDFHSLATDAELGKADPTFAQVQGLLSQAHQNANGGGVAIANTRPSLQANVNVMREELNHTWQRSLTGQITDHLSQPAFTDLYQHIPSGMYEHLIEHGYDGYNSPEIVTESAAKLMDGRPERFGVTNDDAIDFLDRYFKAVSEQHGAQALESLQHVRGIAADAKARAIGEHGGTNSGQDSSTVPSVAAGRPSGVGEGISEPAFNRERDKPIWYLKSERLINEKMKGPQPAEDVQKMLLAGGVKPEEMHWTGLDDFLESKGDEKVTTEEIREHLANNNLQIKEVQMGQPNPTQWTEHVSGVLTTPEGYKVERLANGKYLAISTGGIRQLFDTVNEAKAKVDGWRKSSSEDEVTPKYSSYQLPGSQSGSYREMLLTMPPSLKEATPIEFKETEKYQGEPVYRADVRGGEAVISHNPGFPWRVDLPRGEEDGGFPTAEAAMDAVKKNPRYQFVVPENNVFKSSHWDEPNVLAHVRFNDRTGPNGEKLLHVEETQSDLHQTARKKGYQDQAKQEELLAKSKVAKDEWQAADKEVEDLRNDLLYDELQSDPTAIEESKAKVRTAMGKRSVANDNLRAAQEELRQSFKGVPDAPFKKTWHEMALRRMLQYASTNGYDGLSWTGGEDQAERYDLSKKISKVEWRPRVGNEEQGRIFAFDLDGKPVLTEDIPESKIQDYIGKDVAQKLLESPAIKSETGRRDSKQLSGLDLKVGGEGMHGFYDKIVPDYLNKFGKRYGAKVGAADIQVGSPKHAMEYSDDDDKYYVGGPRADGTYTVRNPNGGDAHYFKDRETAEKTAEEWNKKANSKTVQYLPITPEMRQSISEEGMPLFNREVPQLRLDNPGREWLQKKREQTLEDGRTIYGPFARMGAVTGSYSGRSLVPVDVLRTIPGMNGETPMTRDPYRAQGIADNYRKTGRLPQVNDKDYHPFVMVDQEGKPWVNEGNHRIAGASLAGVKYLPIEVRYFNGGEQEKGVMSPDKLAQYHKQAIDEGYTPENYAARNKVDAEVAFNREQTKTPEFKDWFKDSKVVDKDNNPIPLFHAGYFDEKDDPVPDIGSEGFHFGTQDAALSRNSGKPIDDFMRALKIEKGENENGEERWYWSSGSEESYSYDEDGFKTESEARKDAGNFAQEMEPSDEGMPMTEAYLSIQNPKRIKDQGDDWKAAVAKAKTEGYDGIVYRNEFEDNGKDSYIAFKPEQIKSVNNSGSFDPNDPNILRNREIDAKTAPKYNGGSDGKDDTTRDSDDPREVRRLSEDAFGNDDAGGKGVNGGVSAGEPWTYTRKVHGDDDSVWVLGAPVRETWSLNPEQKDAIRKRGWSSPDIHELEYSNPNSAAAFHHFIKQIKDFNKFGASVHVYSQEEYGQMRMFLSGDGKSGFALRPDGDIVSVFSHGEEAKGSSHTMLEIAKQAGGTKMDAFDTVLPKIYGGHGFRAVARMKWNDEYAPEGWDKETFKPFNDGEPDVVFMVRDPAAKPYQTGDGKTTDDYDEAVRLQQEAIDENKVKEPENWVKVGAQDFAQQHNRAIDTSHYLPVDPRAKDVADAYEAMKDDPSDPKVAAAYKALVKEAREQWDHATKKMGVTFEGWNKPGQPYQNSKEMIEDVKNNHHLYFFRGGDDLSADHPMGAIYPDTGLSGRDTFRAVHDLFGHAAEGFQFGPRGEENAWNAHRQMFSEDAIPALTALTKGQNSWVNYGPHMRDAKGNLLLPGQPGWVDLKDRPYPPQKVGILPKEFQSRPDVDADDPAFNREKPDGTLYHVTETKNVPKILKDGLQRFKTSNWTTRNGERYGKGEVYSFTNKYDAIRWAARMDWELNKKSGSGKISIVRINPGKEKWDTDHSDPLSQSGKYGDWLKSESAIPASQIIDSFPVGQDEIKDLVDLVQERRKSEDTTFNREKSSTEGGSGQSPEQAEGAGKAPTVDNTDKHQLTHVAREDAPDEVKAWDKDQAGKWLGQKPSLKITSQKDEELDPKSLKTTQSWAGSFKLKQFHGMDASTAPPISVLRTDDGDYIVDGVHRAARAAEDGSKVKATVYTVKMPADEPDWVPREDTTKGGYRAPVGTKRIGREGYVDILTNIPISDLVMPSGNILYPQTIKKYEEASASDYPVVTPDERGNVVDDGNHRVEAARRAGKSSVTVWLRQPGYSNLRTKDLEQWWKNNPSGGIKPKAQVLPFAQVRAMAAGLNPAQQVKTRKDLMAEAKQRRP